MNMITGQAEPNYFSQVDFYFTQMSPKRQDFIRLLISKLGELSFTPVSIFIAINGIVKAVSAFQLQQVKVSEELSQLIGELELLSNEMSLIRNNNQINDFLLTKKLKLYREWQLFQTIGATDFGLNKKAIVVAGCYVSQILCGYKVNKTASEVIFKLLNSSEEILSIVEQKCLAKVEFDALVRFASTEYKIDKKLSLDELLPYIFRRKMLYAGDKVRQSALDYETLTVNEFICVARQIRVDCENGSLEALKIILSCFLGLPFKYVDQVLLISENVSDWKLAVDVDLGVILFDLDVVAPYGTNNYNNRNFVPANSILVKPLPSFVWQALLKLRNQFTDAKNLGDLVGGFDDQHFQLDLSVAKLNNSFARVAIQFARLDIFDAAIIANDFRIIQHAKLYYHQTSRQKIWDASSQFFDVIGWGESVPYIDGLAFGSNGVLQDDAVANLFNDLAMQVEKVRPTQKASLNNLLMFHDAFCIYTATLAVFCLALREMNPIRLYSDNFIVGQNYVLINDKNVHGTASWQPVTLCATLRTQLELWKIHCQGLVQRISRNQFPVNPQFMRGLEDIYLGKHTHLFITSTPSNYLSTSQLSVSWPAPLIENFGRHFWETKFAEVGIADRECSAHLRHQSAKNLNWSATSDFVLSSFVERIGIAQEQILKALKINSIGGIAKRCKK